MSELILTHPTVVTGRSDLDFFPTPRWCTLALLRFGCLNIPRELHALDPACGEGAIMDVVRDEYPGANVWGIELHEGRAPLTSPGPARSERSAASPGCRSSSSRREATPGKGRRSSRSATAPNTPRGATRPNGPSISRSRGSPHDHLRSRRHPGRPGPGDPRLPPRRPPALEGALPMIAPPIAFTLGTALALAARAADAALLWLSITRGACR